MRILNVFSPSDLRQRPRLERLERLASSASLNRDVCHAPTLPSVTEGDVLDVVLNVLDVGVNVLNVEALNGVDHVYPQITLQDHYYCLYI